MSELHQGPDLGLSTGQSSYLDSYRAASCRTDADRTFIDCILALPQAVEDEVLLRQLFDVLVAFLQEQRPIPEQATLKVIEILIDSLLQIASTVPSVEAFQALSILFDFIQQDQRIFNRFKPSKSTLQRMSLDTYLQGQDRTRAEVAMDFILFLLESYEHLEPSAFSADTAIISKILWSSRKRDAAAIREMSELTKMRQDIEYIRTMAESHVGELQALANQQRATSRNMEQYASLASDVQGVQTQTAQMVADNESQSAELQTLQLSMRTQDQSLDKLTENVCEIKEQIRLLHDSAQQTEAQSSGAQQVHADQFTQAAQRIDQLEAQVAQLRSDLAAATQARQTHEEGLAEVDSQARASREHALELDDKVQSLSTQVERIDAALKTQEDSAAHLAHAHDQALHSQRADLQALQDAIKQVLDDRSTSTAQLQGIGATMREQDQKLQRVQFASRKATEEVDKLSATTKSALNYVKETLRTQGFAIQKLRLGVGAQGAVCGVGVGVPGGVGLSQTPGSSAVGSAQEDNVAPMSPMLARTLRGAPTSQNLGGNPHDLFMQIAQLEAKQKVQQDTLVDVDTTLRQLQQALQETQTKQTLEASAHQRLEASTEYETRQLRTQIDQHEFTLQETGEQLRSVQHLARTTEQVAKSIEQELHQAQSSVRYLTLGIEQLQATSRTQSSSMRHLEELSANREQTLITIGNDLKQSEHSFQSFRQESDQSMQQLRTILEAQKSAASEAREMNHQHAAAISTLQSQHEQLRSAVTSHHSSTSTSIHQLKNATETNETDVMRVTVQAASNEKALREIETKLAQHAQTLNEFRTASKQLSTQAHQAAVSISAHDGSIERLQTNLGTVEKSNSLLNSMFSTHEASLLKWKGAFEEQLGQLRTTAKHTEAETQTLKTHVKTHETLLIDLSNATRSTGAEACESKETSAQHAGLLQHLQHLYESSQERMGQLHHDLEERSNELRAARQEIDMSNGVLEMLQDQIKQITISHRDDTAQVHSLQQMSDVYARSAGTITRLEAELSTVREQCRQLMVLASQQSGAPAGSPVWVQKAAIAVAAAAAESPQPAQGRAREEASRAPSPPATPPPPSGRPHTPRTHAKQPSTLSQAHTPHAQPQQPSQTQTQTVALPEVTSTRTTRLPPISQATPASPLPVASPKVTRRHQTSPSGPEDVRHSVSQLSTSLSELKAMTSSQQREIQALKDKQRSDLESAASQRREAQQFIIEEARTKLKLLEKTSLKFGEKMHLLQWFARHLKWIAVPVPPPRETPTPGGVPHAPVHTCSQFLADIVHAFYNIFTMHRNRFHRSSPKTSSVHDVLAFVRVLCMTTTTPALAGAGDHSPQARSKPTAEVTSLALECLDIMLQSDNNVEEALSDDLQPATLFEQVGVSLDRAMPPLHTLSTVQQRAIVSVLLVVGSLARNDNYVRHLVQSSVERHILAMMRSSTFLYVSAESSEAASRRAASEVEQMMIAHALHCLRMMLRTDSGCAAIRRAEGFPIIVSLLNAPSAMVVEQAAGALRNAARDDECAQIIADCHGLETMLQVARSEEPRFSNAAKNALGALRNCAKNVRIQRTLRLLGAFNLLGIKYPAIK
eukprot:gnl/Trimastix_PCT/1289.p1 GENE.gnl/Trimastix_PCT/1289~~gnl/Trimastix_PCT/1289.p1  ORF type:complete len:1603 (-),score=602.96 gnl/Trimastix_PCT/1289:116-4894(-)